MLTVETTAPVAQPDSPATRFIGREAELSALGVALSGRDRLLTLVGPGGIGKTRLALRAASRWRLTDGRVGMFGPVVADLTSIGEPQLVEAAIADAVTADAGTGCAPGTIVADIGNKPGLLVIDGCEHLIDAAGQMAVRLLEECPSLTVLATSREPLGIPGEAIWNVPPLSTERSTASGGTAWTAAHPSEAAALFLDRAATTSELCSDSTLLIVESLVHALDGVPLAIEWAAAQTYHRPLAEVADGVGDLMSAEVGGGTARHPSVRGSLDKSYELLTAGEKLLFRRLSVFSPGWTFAAAEHVCTDDRTSRDDVRGHLMGLIDKSLVDVSQDTSETRCRMLAPVRRYAAARFAAGETDGDADRTAERHRSWYLAVAERAADKVSAFSREGRARLSEDLPNISAALENASCAADRDALRIAAALGSFWCVTGRHAEGMAATSRALAATSGDAHEARVRALAVHSMLMFRTGDLKNAASAGLAAIAMAQHVGDEVAFANVLCRLGGSQIMAGTGAGRPLLELALHLGRIADNGMIQEHARTHLAIGCVWRDDFAMLDVLAADGRAASGGLGTDEAAFWLAWGRTHQARLAGDLEAARRHAAEAMKLTEDADALFRVPAIEAASLVDVMAGEADRARGLLLDELASFRDDDLQEGGGLVRCALGTAELGRGNVSGARAIVQPVLDDDPGRGQGYVGRHAQEVLLLAALGECDAPAAVHHATLLNQIATRLGNRRVAGVAQNGLARASILQGDFAPAEELGHAALTAAVESASVVDAIASMETLTAVSVRRGRLDRATRLYLGIQEVRSTRGLVRLGTDTHWWNVECQEIRAGLDRREAEPIESGPVTVPQLAEFAARGRGSRSRPGCGPGSLTPMELNVARRAARGMSNTDIAAELFVARGTVKSHMSSVFTKLGVSNRTKLAVLGFAQPDTFTDADAFGG